MLVLFILMFINWTLETFKWKKLIQDVQKISCSHAFQSVLAGITFGLLTPKRLGEVGGRVLLLEHENRIKGLLGFGLGSLIQSSVTILFGLFALISLLLLMPGINRLNINTLLPVSAGLFFFLMLSIFNLKFILKHLKNLPFFRSKKHIFSHLENQSTKKIAFIFLLGVLRYIVFSIQFFLLIRLFGASIETLQAFAGISLTYLVLTFSPFSSILELGIRGSVASFVFGLFTSQTGSIVLASLAIWLINLGFPALMGGLVLYHSEKLKLPGGSFRKKIRWALKRA